MQTSREVADSLRNAIFMFDSGHELARQPGSFMELLLRMIAYADEFNRARLAEGFPQLVWAVETLQRADDGYEQVAASIRELEG